MMASFRQQKNIEKQILKISENVRKKYAREPFPGIDAGDESKNRYLVKLIRVQCRLRMHKMVELSGSFGRKVRVARRRGQENAKIRVAKGKRSGRVGGEREKWARFKCSLEWEGVGTETRR